MTDALANENGPPFDVSLLSPLEGNLLFALAYVTAFIDETKQGGREAKKLAQDNLDDAYAEIQKRSAPQRPS